MHESIAIAQALVVNAWTAFSPIAALAGLGGAGLLAAALIGLTWLPGFAMRPLIALGLGLLVGAAIFQAGTAKGAHDAFARDAARALAVAEARTAAAHRITDTLSVQAVRDLAAKDADVAKLKALLHDAEKRAGAARICLPRDVARGLRNL